MRDEHQPRVTPGGAVQPAALPPERLLRVLVWDEVEARRQRIAEELAPCAAEIHTLHSSRDLESAKAETPARIALVAFEGSPAPANPALTAVRTLRRRGFSVCAYGDQLLTWPLRDRCRALLAGAQNLLDSTAATFGQQLRDAINAGVQQAARDAEERQQTMGTMRRLGVVGASEAMIAVFRRVLRVSRLSDLPVLLQGETGTGKELLARAIYQLDPKRNRGPFVALNCSALSKGLAESELFGHRRGAFTGAEQSRKGLIRAADGGVLLLDEIGDLDGELQAKLLRVLQESRVLSLGEDFEVPVSVRVLVATNRDLQQMVRAGGFRADLFYRLNVVSIQVPPLRTRLEDLPSLVNHFIEKSLGPQPQRQLRAGGDFMEALAESELLGNARQVENLVRRAVAQKDDDAPLGLADLPPEFLLQLSTPQEDSSFGPVPAREASPAVSSEPGELDATLHRLLGANDGSLSGALEQCERVLLEAALKQTSGNQSRAARLLGITPRSVYSKLRKHRMNLSR